MTTANLSRAAALPRLFAPACVDLFSGGGGWSIGAERAFVRGGHADRRMDLAVNHWDAAIACHEANHPCTEHAHSSVFDVDPDAALPGRRIAYLHASPDCTHFSKARGSKPVKKEIRGLAWVVVDWAKKRRPDVITLENVEEFTTWGPLDDATGQPDPKHRGETFAAWVASLEQLGYRVEWRVLRACDYGAPTTRKRLYIVARCDEHPITWPEPTHGPSTDRRRHPLSWPVDLLRPHTRGVSDRRIGELKPHLSAASCIDWSEPMCSIFAAPTEAKAWAREHGRHTPKRPLAEKTLRRIARGTVKYVLESADPFILQVQNGSSQNGSHGIGKPFPTVTANPKGGGHALVAPTLIQTGYGERPGQDPRSLDLQQPLGTVVGGGSKHALVATYLAKHVNGSIGTHADEPLHTVTGVWNHGVVAAFLGDHGHTGGRRVAAFLDTYYGSTRCGTDARDHAPTVTDTDRIGLVTVDIASTTWAVVDIALRMLTPRELANAQGFPPDYVIDRDSAGRPLSKRDQVKIVGNSVCPPVAEAIVYSNVVRPGVLDAKPWKRGVA